MPNKKDNKKELYFEDLYVGQKMESGRHLHHLQAGRRSKSSARKATRNLPSTSIEAAGEGSFFHGLAALRRGSPPPSSCAFACSPSTSLGGMIGAGAEEMRWTRARPPRTTPFCNRDRSNRHALLQKA